jgi:hypothetical protein
MPILFLILLIILALVVLTGVILSLISGLFPVPRLPFPPEPQKDFFQLIRTITITDILWHPGRGDLPDPSGEITPPDLPNHPME